MRTTPGLFAVSLFFGLFSVVVSASTPGPPSVPVSWRSDVEPFVKTLSRPLMIYTWEHRSTYAPGVDALEPQDPRAAAFLAREAVKFWDGRVPRIYPGGPNGPYFASDPFASREYGNGQDTPEAAARDPNWSLIRVTLPVGARLIDARIYAAVPASVQAYLAQFGCGQGSVYSLFRQKDGRCHQAFTSLAREVGAVGAQMYFPAYGPAACPDHSRMATDYVLWDTGAMRDFAVLSAWVPTPDRLAGERAFIQAYYLHTKDYIESTFCRGGPAPVPWGSRFATVGKCETCGKCAYYWTSPARYQSPWPTIAPMEPGEFAGHLAMIMGCSAQPLPEDLPVPQRQTPR